jgi:hypothetical protein
MTNTMDTVYKILNSLSALHCSNYMQELISTPSQSCPRHFHTNRRNYPQFIYIQTLKWLVAVGGGYGVTGAREDNKKVKLAMQEVVEGHRVVRRLGSHIF